jgi:hypothetical protein
VGAEPVHHVFRFPAKRSGDNVMDWLCPTMLS